MSPLKACLMPDKGERKKDTTVMFVAEFSGFLYSRDRRVFLMLQAPQKLVVEDPVLNLCVEENLRVSVGFPYATVLQLVMHNFFVHNLV